MEAYKDHFVRQVGHTSMITKELSIIRHFPTVVVGNMTKQIPYLNSA
jgi:hypothetical protein